MKIVYDNEKGLIFPSFSPIVIFANRHPLPSQERHIVANRILFSVKSRPESFSPRWPRLFFPPFIERLLPIEGKICPVLERPFSVTGVKRKKVRAGEKLGNDERNSARVRGWRWEGGTCDNFPSYHQMPWAIYFTLHPFLIHPFIPYIPRLPSSRCSWFL